MPTPREATLMRPELEPARGLEETLALDAADQMIGRDTIVLENQLCRVDRLVAELRQFSADRKTLHSSAQ